jgi:hypothetical protein
MVTKREDRNDPRLAYTALEGSIMQFDERLEGDYRIFVGALDAPRGNGYIAAVVVSRHDAQHGRDREVWRDDSLACGYRWQSATEALGYAMNRAREMVRKDSPMLAA